MKQMKIFCFGIVVSILLSAIVPVLSLAIETTNSIEEGSTERTQEISDIEVEDTSKQTKKTSEESTINEQESTEEKKTKEDSQSNTNLELNDELKDNPYFPINPTEEDILGSKVLPGEISLPDEPLVTRGITNYYSATNQAIINKKYKNPTIQYSHKSVFPKMNYKDGMGKPRGVVVHETANPNSTIWNEIDYMTRNWQSAFVHGFVDANNIVEIHPTDYSVWGAGAQANPYFIQIELVEHVNSREDFLKSINNDAYYVAYNLKKYNLTPSRSGGGPGNPVGTVWSHHEVSSRLGGTNHTDPTGYFAKFNYTFTEFYELVQYKFNEIDYANISSDVEYVAKSGIVKNDNYGIFDKPAGSFEAKKIGEESTYLNKNVEITRKATLEGSDKIFYQFKYEGKIIGWLDSKAFSVWDPIISQQFKNMYANVATLNVSKDYSIYNGVFNTDASVLKISQGNMYADKVVKIVQEANTVKGTWYQFKIDENIIGWMNSLAFNPFDEIYTNNVVTLNNVLVNKEAVNYDVHDKIYGTSPEIKVVAQGSEYLGEQVQLFRKANTVKGTWYQFGKNDQIIGWLKSDAFTISNELISQTHNQSNNWQNPKANGEVSESVETEGINGLKIKIDNPEFSGSVQYNARIRGYGFDYIRQNDEITGFLGVANPLEIIKVNLTGDLAKHYDIYYRSNVENFGWLGWAKNGEYSGTKDYIYSILDFQVQLVKKGNAAPGSTENAYMEKIFTPKINYSVNLRTGGWQPEVSDGTQSGMLSGNQIDALKVNLSELPTTAQGGVEYNARIQNYGFDYIRKNNEVTGFVGKGAHLEIFKAKLTGEISKQYDLYYQTNVQGLGWLGWAKNDEWSGSMDYNYPIVGLKIQLVKKGESAPGTTKEPFKKKKETPNINYSSYIDSAWQETVKNGNVSGIQNVSRIDGLRVNITNTPNNKKGEVEYNARIQNYGWDYIRKNNEVTGILGSGLQLEVFKLNLTGEIKDIYNVYYRVYLQGVGWLGWAMNGQQTGSYTSSKAIQGIQIQLVNKEDTFLVDDTPTIYGEIDTSTVQGKFVASVVPYALQEAPKRDLFVSVMIAQAILESNYGRSVLAEQHHNYYGIKGKFNGESVIIMSGEDDGHGNITMVPSEFKKYPGLCESIQDYGDKLFGGVSWDPLFYKGSWKSVAKTYQNATQALQGKYATDIKYAEKLNRVIAEWNLSQFDY